MTETGPDDRPGTLEQRELNRQVAIHCMQWRVGTVREWCRLTGIGEPSEDELLCDIEMDYWNKPIYLDKDNRNRHEVDNWSPDCGPTWWPCEVYDDAWQAAEAMGATKVTLTRADGKVECCVEINKLHIYRSGSCPAEALSKALVAFVTSK